MCGNEVRNLTKLLVNLVKAKLKFLHRVTPREKGFLYIESVKCRRFKA